MISCPNKRLKSWKDLASSVGELDALALWNQYKGNVPQVYYNRNNNGSAVSSVEPVVSPKSSNVDFNSLIDENAESIFNDLDDDTLPSKTKYQSNELLFGNKYAISVDEVLDNIASNFEDINDDTKELLLRAKKLAGKSKATIKFITESELENDQAVMGYESDDNSIRVSKSRLERFDEQEAVIAFLHEVVHGQTVQAILKDPSERTFAEQELVDVVTNFMKKYADNKRLSAYYGFNYGNGINDVSVAEFVAEFYANPEFRNAVKEVSDSFWKQIMDAVRRLFDIKANPEYKKLFETIINYTEQSHIDYSGLKRYDSVFYKETEKKEIIKPTLVTFQDHKEYVLRKAKDNVAQVLARTKASANSKNKSDNAKHVSNIESLIKSLEEVEDAEQLKAVVQYTRSLAKTIAQVEKGMARIYKTTKDFRDAKDKRILDKINAFEDYLASYDLIDDIGDLLARSKREKLSEQDAEAIDEIKKTLAYAKSTHSDLLKEFHDIQREQSISLLSDPKFNTKVEADHRNRLYKEYRDLGITGESREEYTSRMLNTRDKELYKKDLVASAEKLANDPSFDISAYHAKFGDSLNTNSRLIQILVTMFNSVRDTILKEYSDFNFKISGLFDEVVKEKGTGIPSKMYKNIYEQDKNGNYYFKGEYKIEFRDKYIEEYIPLKNELNRITQELTAEGLKKLEMRSRSEYMTALENERKWLKDNTIKDLSDQTGRGWFPNDSYKNKKLSGVDQKIQDMAIEVLKFSHKSTSGKQSLIKRAGYAQFYKFPAITKSNEERMLELEGKGIIKDFKEDFTTIKPDDIGYGEAIDKKTGEAIKSVKVHFRGDLSADQQSMDVMTMLRKEYLNAINYKHKRKAEIDASLIANISKNKSYFKTSADGGILSNIFNKNEPAETIPGEHTQEYARIKGLIERNIYDTMSTHGGTFMGMDVNKLTNFINGMTASVGMSLNIASGTANIANGFTQLFVEAFGGDTFNTASLLKAEGKYTLDLPYIMADLGNPVKKSFTNQLLQMYDVFGGFDPQTQDFIKNSVAKKLANKESLNFMNESGENAMNAILTMSVLDSLKVMNSNHKFIDKEGNEVDESKAASLLDLLSLDESGKLVMSDKVKFTKQNFSNEYHEGGKTHVNLLIKNKVFDLFGVYDANFKNEVSKHWLGKSLMMFKNFLLPGMQYRFQDLDKARKKKSELTEDDMYYNSAKKQYTEGTFTTLARFFIHGVIPTLKSLQLAHMSEAYNELTDLEKSNLRKSTTEVLLTMALLPAVSMMLGAAAGDDDDELWFLIYQVSRLETEIAQYRNPVAATKIISNPIAGVKVIQNALNFIYEVVTPINLVPDNDENFFSYMDEDAKHKNILYKRFKKIVPGIAQFGDEGFLGKNYKQLNGLVNK
jgi:hypothetical protein